MIEDSFYLLTFLILINLFAVVSLWDVVTTPKEININLRMIALWAFITNLVVLSYNFSLMFEVISST